MKLNELGVTLRVLNQHVDFAALAESIDHAVPRPSRQRGCRPPFPTEQMMRVLLTQQLFNLSDEQMELQLLDHPSFTALCRLRTSRQIRPHHNLDVQAAGNQGWPERPCLTRPTVNCLDTATLRAVAR